MEFDRSRVYSSVNADRLRAGDKVIVANTMVELRKDVKEGFIADVVTLKEVGGEDCLSRFIVNEGWFLLAYLVERAENCTNCGEGKWDAQHQKILCDPVHCGKGNVVFRNHETEVCEYWKPISKMPKTEKKADKHTDCNHCEEAVKATNACLNKHFRPFRDSDELVEEWDKKLGYTDPTGSKLTKPYIWVRSKFNKDHKGVLINNYFGEYVELGTVQCFLERLFGEYTFLDGSPCGVEE